MLKVGRYQPQKIQSSHLKPKKLQHHTWPRKKKLKEKKKRARRREKSNGFTRNGPFGDNVFKIPSTHSLWQSQRKLRLVKSAKQSRSLCSGPLSVYQELSKSHDWPLEKANVELPIRMKGNSQLTSDNSFIRWAPRTSISALLRRRC